MDCAERMEKDEDDSPRRYVMQCGDVYLCEWMYGMYYMNDFVFWYDMSVVALK